MSQTEFLNQLKNPAGCLLGQGTALCAKMHEISQEAIRISAEIKTGYHPPEKILPLARMFLLIAGVSFKIREASPLETAR